MPSAKLASALALIEPEWPAPVNVRAFATTRTGGVSQSPYDSLNLGTRCGDDPQAVAENRRRLVGRTNLPAAPIWLQQVHGTNVINAATVVDEVEADASYTTETGVVCAVLTADCLPVLLCDRAGICVAAVHAGWRGLAAGIVENAIAAMPVEAKQLMAWLGPAIGPEAYEVGAEVRDAFVCALPSAARCFKPTRPDHWHANLYELARQRLVAAGVTRIDGGVHCTLASDRFFSYRRDHETGRQLSGIFLASSN